MKMIVKYNNDVLFNTAKTKLCKKGLCRMQINLKLN